ncbi:MAG: AAA family ATPase [Anaerolineae bacterium]|nr:AAA family ATPase [Anaerolineae bacterium]
MADNSPNAFSSEDRALIIAPAGCGKTELIAQAVACQDSGRQLILTHTHAGVRSLRDRLKKFGVSSQRYNLDTIAGFSLKYAAAYPKLSGLGEFSPTEHDWEKVYQSGVEILSNKVGKKILSATYSGLYVDEYQDCTLAQHNLIMNMADLLPCRIVGDPLQGVFDFEHVVDWFKDVFPNFVRLPDLKTPWRWEKTNKKLGTWLQDIRHCLLTGKPFVLTKSPAKWVPLNPKNQRSACLHAMKTAGTIVAIHKWPNQAHSVAQKLNGAFSSMEEVESKDLLKWTAKIEECTGPERAVAVIDFASCCMTKVSTEFRSIRRNFEAGRPNFSKKLKNLDVAIALSNVANSDDFKHIVDACAVIGGVQGPAIYRHELWYDMQKAVREFDSGDYSSLSDAAWSVRDKGRILGRRVYHRTISRTLLVKGLEFDHSIVLDATNLNAKELYVAMTRGSKSLTVLSPSPVLKKERPVFKK